MAALWIGVSSAGSVLAFEATISPIGPALAKRMTGVYDARFPIRRMQLADDQHFSASGR